MLTRRRIPPTVGALYERPIFLESRKYGRSSTAPTVSTQLLHSSQDRAYSRADRSHAETCQFRDRNYLAVHCLEFRDSAGREIGKKVTFPKMNTCVSRVLSAAAKLQAVAGARRFTQGLEYDAVERSKRMRNEATKKFFTRR
jgi:hypothetical protein